ncbi:MAG: adenylyltransferase/cytidyltransferase family protein, partial [Desulfobacterales bacterium]|nr:adenylyltransferase/cytidyltransferase family protein [Desulfobacterales bacterium]
MKLDLYRKIVDIDVLTELSDQLRAEGKTIVHCHGCFDIVHPGHVRYLQFARQQGDSLVVSLTGDDAIEKEDGTRPYIPQELRAENLAALEFVDHVVIADGPTAEPILAALRPHLYIKGKEYEHSTHPGFLAEQQRVEEAGGRVIFSSGQVVFSSTKLITDHITTAAENLHDTTRLGACCARWGVDANQLRNLVTEQFKGKRIAVIGDC